MEGVLYMMIGAPVVRRLSPRNWANISGSLTHTHCGPHARPAHAACPVRCGPCVVVLVSTPTLPLVLPSGNKTVFGCIRPGRAFGGLVSAARPCARDELKQRVSLLANRYVVLIAEYGPYVPTQQADANQYARSKLAMSL